MDEATVEIIREKPLILNNLSKVNYLVGKNGSGKSSVLEAINLIMFDYGTTLLHDIKNKFQNNLNGKILDNLLEKSDILLNYVEFYRKEFIEIRTSIELSNIETLNQID